MLRTHHLVLSQAVAVAFRPSFSAVVIFSCNTFTPHKPLYTLKSLHQNINRTRLKASNVDEAYKALGIPLGSRKRDIKAAYYELMKQLHPDVNPDKDTTFEAAKLNLAYQYLLDNVYSDGSNDNDAEPDPFDCFDLPETKPDEIFINPFGCYGLPLEYWRELQEVARSTSDPETALRKAGVIFNESALYYLTPKQVEILEMELERAALAADQLSAEACAFLLAELLMRARVANNRMPVR